MRLFAAEIQTIITKNTLEQLADIGQQRNWPAALRRSMVQKRAEFELHPPLPQSTTVEEDQVESNPLLMSDALADVLLNVEVEDTPNTTLPGHRSILASRSEYFRTMFIGPFLEADSSVVNIVGYTTTAVPSMLDHIYHGKISKYLPQDVDAEMELLRLADHYQLPTLCKDIYDRLRHNIEDPTLDKAGLLNKRCEYLSAITFVDAKALGFKEKVVDLSKSHHLNNETVFVLLDFGVNHSERLEGGCMEYFGDNWATLRSTDAGNAWLG